MNILENVLILAVATEIAFLSNHFSVTFLGQIGTGLVFNIPLLILLQVARRER